MTAGSLAWMASLAFACALLGGCAATPAHAAPLSSEAAFNAADLGTTPPGPIDDPTLFPDDDGDSAPAAVEGARLQCVPYARAHSNIDLHGNAYTWWDKAAGVYARSSTPVVDSVIALNGYGRHRGHVAVVRRIVSPREIRIDHANWLDDRAIYVNDPVVDVSADNDWSVVKVWNIRSNSWGTRTYRVQGFIGPEPDGAHALVASYRKPLQDDPIARQIAASPVAPKAAPDDPIARQIAAPALPSRPAADAIARQIALSQGESDGPDDEP